jgi:hypothetical protein
MGGGPGLAGAYLVHGLLVGGLVEQVRIDVDLVSGHEERWDRAVGEALLLRL